MCRKKCKQCVLISHFTANKSKGKKGAIAAGYHYHVKLCKAPPLFTGLWPFEAAAAGTMRCCS